MVSSSALLLGGRPRLRKTVAELTCVMFGTLIGSDNLLNSKVDKLPYLAIDLVSQKIPFVTNMLLNVNVSDN